MIKLNLCNDPKMLNLLLNVHFKIAQKHERKVYNKTEISSISLKKTFTLTKLQTI